MAQIYANIFVKVRDSALWEKLYDLQLRDEYCLGKGTGRDVWGKVNGDEWVINQEWSPSFNGLDSLVQNIANRIDTANCIIFSCITDYNVDMFADIYYSLGKVNHGIERRHLNTCDDWPEITNISEWLKWSGIKLTPERFRFMLEFGDRFSFLQKRFAGISAEDETARLFVSVKELADWNKLAALDLSDEKYGLPGSAKELFGNLESFDFAIDIGWKIKGGFEEDSTLYKLITLVRNAVGVENCVVFADYCDADKSVPYSVYFGIGDKETIHESTGNIRDVSIEKIRKWLESAGFVLSENRVSILSAFPSKQFDFVKDKAIKNEQKKEEERLNEEKRREERAKEDISLAEQLYDSSTGYTEVGRIENSAKQICCISMSGNTNVKRVRITEGVEAVSRGCFRGCTELEEVVLPSTLKLIEENAFQNCAKLNSVIFTGEIELRGNAVWGYDPKDREDYDSEQFFEWINNRFDNTPYLQKVLEADTVYFGGILYLSKEEELTIKEGTTGVIYGALESAKKLSIPSTIKAFDIGKWFGENDLRMDELEEIVIEDGLTELANRSIYDLNYLTKVTIPASVTQIDDEVFCCYTKKGKKYIPNKLDDLVIYGAPGSEAEAFAKRNGYAFEEL